MEAPNGTLADNLRDQLTTDEQSPISQSKESEIFIEKTFRKRHGTTDKGKKYENMITANIILRLISSDKVNNSYVSSNHPDFGDFDDLVVETEAHERVETTAVQLKHSGRDHLKLTQLASEKGDFSLFKYFHSSQNIKKKPQQFILLTNLKFEAPNKTKFQLDKSGLFLELSEEIISEDFLKISQDTSYCYKFQILEDGNTKIKFSKLQEFKSFLEQFRLYPNQESLETLKKSTMNRFVEMFGSNEETFEKYLNIISEWDMHEGAKNKLDRNIMQRAIALCLLSPYVENFTSGAVSPKGKTLREAICLFDFTLLRNNECDAVKQLWGDVDEDIDINEVNKVRSFYRLSSNYLSRIEEADGNVLTQLLWLMDKRPLILKEQENIEKAIELCPDAKFVVLGEGKSREWMNHRSVFQNLLDLKSKHKLYKTVMETFTVSLQGKPVLTLKDASGGNEEFLKKITINDLLEMVDSPRLIDEGKVALPDPYIERQGAVLPDLTSDGKRISIGRTAKYDFETPNIADIVKLVFMAGDLRIKSEEIVVFDVYVVDLNFPLAKHFFKVNPLVFKKMFMCIQEAFPVIIKEVHLINAPFFSKFVINVIKAFLSPALSEVIHVHTSIETLYEFVPKNILPEEYGGNAGKLSDLYDQWIRTFEEHRSWFEKEENIKADLSIKAVKRV